jgi:hypothetical protein
MVLPPVLEIAVIGGLAVQFPEQLTEAPEQVSIGHGISRTGLKIVRR